MAAAIARLGRFVIREQIGAGGMGVVYRARDETLQRDVALKVLSEQIVRDERFRRRMLIEARAAAAINHPAIATVYDVGEDGDGIYIAMELVEGMSLRERMAQPIDVAEAFEIAIAVCGALAKAHEAGVVHRDIKPENIMLTGSGVKVLDFGIARRERADADVDTAADTAVADTRLTAEGTVLGTPGYMSPEQTLGLETDSTSDLFALGVTLYEMLGGALPFRGTTLMEIAVSVTRDEPAPLAAHFPQAWASLEETLASCLAKDRAERIGSALVLQERLRGHLDEWRSGAGARRATTAVRRPPARRALIVAAAALAIVAVLWWSTRPEPRAAPGASPSATPSAIPITDLPPPKAGNDRALAAYQRALAAFRASAWGRARAELESAVELDPNFTAAHMRLAMLYSSIAGVGDAAQSSYRFALEHRDDLSLRDQVMLGTIEPLFAAPPDWKRYHRMLVDAAHLYPGDAEFHFLACASAQRIGLMVEALPHARRAAELDPSYGDAWQSIANILAALGRSEEAYDMLGVCIEKVPTSLDCLADRVLLASLRGQCEQAFRDAQMGIKRGGDGAWYERVAQLAAASGRPYEAVAEAMRQASTRYPRAEAAFRPLQNQLELDVYRGDLAAAAARSAELVAEVEKRDELHLRVVNQMRRALILEELGEVKRAAAEAKALVAASDALSRNALNTIGHDRMPMLYRVMHAGGGIDDAELARLRAAWLDHWSNRHGSVADLWLHGHLEMVASASDAKAAVAARPADFTVERVYRSDFHRGVIGRAYLMAGELDEAVLHLRASTQSCAVLSRPIRYVQDHLLLGRALEANGDSVGACKAYGYVVERWGKTISVSAAEAKKRITALACK